MHPRGGDEFVPSAADIEPVRLQLRAIATELLEDLRPRDMFDVIAEFAAPLSRCILSEIRSSAPVDDLASWVELTVDLIGNGALALLNHRDQLAWLRATLEQAGAAVDELLRFDGPLQRTARAALVDVELPEGDVVQAGETLTLLLGAANRDYSQFAEPDRLDLGRSNANRHLAFGAGNHECLGSCWRGSRPRLAWGSWRGGCRHCISPSRRRAGGRASRCGGWKRSTWPAEAGPDLVVGDLVPKTRGDPLTPTGIPWSSMHAPC
ncbi:MAG: cytochrome P450 [Chloroflexi bacterium]|nr:cytochrome P450 [Chloroflexota bacterium]